MSRPPTHQRSYSAPPMQVAKTETNTERPLDHRRTLSLDGCSVVPVQPKPAKKQMNKEKCKNKMFNSCTNCRKLHQRCVVSKEGGPCDRCIKRGCEGSCVFEVQKRRGPAKGWQERRQEREAAKKLAGALENAKTAAAAVAVESLSSQSPWPASCTSWPSSTESLLMDDFCVPVDSARGRSASAIEPLLTLMHANTVAPEAGINMDIQGSGKDLFDMYLNPVVPAPQPLREVPVEYFETWINMSGIAC